MAERLTDKTVRDLPAPASGPAWTVKQAASRAGELRRQIDGGEDPLAARDQDRAGRSMADLWAAVEADHLLDGAYQATPGDRLPASRTVVPLSSESEGLRMTWSVAVRPDSTSTRSP